MASSARTSEVLGLTPEVWCVYRQGLVGAAFEFELPHAGKVEAEVIWNSGEYYGCQFALPISPAALSAALLQAEAQPSADAEHDPVAELKQLNAEVERLAWKMDNALRRLTKK